MYNQKFFKEFLSFTLAIILVFSLLPRETFAIEKGNLTTKNKTFSSGYSHRVVIKQDGTVWGLGSNYLGQLGVGSIENKNIETLTQTKGISNVVYVSAGWGSTYAIKQDGTAWAWGSNYNGALGDGTIEDRHAPVQVKNISNVVEISAAKEGNFAVALTSDGSVWTWGYNGFGQLGNGTKTDSHIPIKVIGLDNVISVSAGYGFILALKDDGTVWAWGLNRSGRLGSGIEDYKVDEAIDNSRTDRLDSSAVPIQVKNLKNIVAISAGWDHSLALDSDGKVWSWGNNHYGKLGDGTTTIYDEEYNIIKDNNKYSPVQVKNINNAISISAHYGTSSVLKKDGTVWGFGAVGGETYGEQYVQELPITEAIPLFYENDVFRAQDESKLGMSVNEFIDISGTSALTKNGEVFIASNSFHLDENDKPMIELQESGFYSRQNVGGFYSSDQSVQVQGATIEKIANNVMLPNASITPTTEKEIEVEIKQIPEGSNNVNAKVITKNFEAITVVLVAFSNGQEYPSTMIQQQDDKNIWTFQKNFTTGGERPLQIRAYYDKINFIEYNQTIFINSVEQLNVEMNPPDNIFVDDNVNFKISSSLGSKLENVKAVAISGGVEYPITTGLELVSETPYVYSLDRKFNGAGEKKIVVTATATDGITLRWEKDDIVVLEKTELDELIVEINAPEDIFAGKDRVDFYVKSKSGLPLRNVTMMIDDVYDRSDNLKEVNYIWTANQVFLSDGYRKITFNAIATTGQVLKEEIYVLVLDPKVPILLKTKEVLEFERNSQLIPFDVGTIICDNPITRVHIGVANWYGDEEEKGLYADKQIYTKEFNLADIPIRTNDDSFKGENHFVINIFAGTTEKSMEYVGSVKLNIKDTPYIEYKDPKKRSYVGFDTTTNSIIAECYTNQPLTGDYRTILEIKYPNKEDRFYPYDINGESNTNKTYFKRYFSPGELELESNKRYTFRLSIISDYFGYRDSTSEFELDIPDRVFIVPRSQIYSATPDNLTVEFDLNKPLPEGYTIWLQNMTTKYNTRIEATTNGKHHYKQVFDIGMEKGKSYNFRLVVTNRTSVSQKNELNLDYFDYTGESRVYVPTPEDVKLLIIPMLVTETNSGDNLVEYTIQDIPKNFNDISQYTRDDWSKVYEAYGLSLVDKTAGEIGRGYYYLGSSINNYMFNYDETMEEWKWFLKGSTESLKEHITKDKTFIETIVESNPALYMNYKSTVGMINAVEYIIETYDDNVTYGTPNSHGKYFGDITGEILYIVILSKSSEVFIKNFQLSKGSKITLKGTNATKGSGSTETYYRTMSQTDYQTFLKTGKIPATGETFISPSQAYSSGYDGVLVEFKVNSGTTSSLEAIGVRNASTVTNVQYPDMPIGQSGWTNTNAYFKGEGGTINIGLGKGDALNIFNNNITDFKVIGGK